MKDSLILTRAWFLHEKLNQKKVAISGNKNWFDDTN